MNSAKFLYKIASITTICGSAKPAHWTGRAGLDVAAKWALLHRRLAHWYHFLKAVHLIKSALIFIDTSTQMRQFKA
jgi:hypothetical protein